MAKITFEVCAEDGREVSAREVVSVFELLKDVVRSSEGGNYNDISLSGRKYQALWKFEKSPVTTLFEGGRS